eukprot:gene12229-12367_t
MQAWGHVSSHLQQPSSSQLHEADSNEDATTELILEALKLTVRSLSRVPVSSPGSGARLPGAGASSSTPAVKRSLALAAALSELYASGLPLDAASIAAGVVADAVDVGALHIRTVQAKLGPEVAGLVHDMLAVRHAPDRAEVYDDANSSALRSWLLTAYDVRACAVEVAWRWLDLAQQQQQPQQQGGEQQQALANLAQQQLCALEALTIYCPLGHALGLGVCATGLEDAAFKVLFPSSYASTARQVLPYSAAAAELLMGAQTNLQQAAAADATFNSLAAGVQLLGRTKSLYSIMRKLLCLQDPAAGSRKLWEMYDLLGLRAVVLPRDDLAPEEAEAAAVRACYRLQSAEVVLECETEGYDRLALVLEFVKAPGADLAVLQARNISRVVRDRLHAAQFRVNGQPLLLPHRAAAQVNPGDVIEFGETGVSFLVQLVNDRRLWRSAANIAFKLPYDLATAAGGGIVLHSWAAAEFDRDNVVNARIVIGEALRKCPKDAGVSHGGVSQERHS